MELGNTAGNWMSVVATVVVEAQIPGWHAQAAVAAVRTDCFHGFGVQK